MIECSERLKSEAKRDPFIREKTEKVSKDIAFRPQAALIGLLQTHLILAPPLSSDLS